MTPITTVSGKQVLWNVNSGQFRSFDSIRLATEHPSLAWRRNFCGMGIASESEKAHLASLYGNHLVNIAQLEKHR